MDSHHLCYLVNCHRNKGDVFYRYMSRAEHEAVKRWKRLRGDRPGTSYFTKDVDNSAKQAKSNLALADGDIPDVRVKVRIKNSPKTVKRNKVKATASESGGGSEFLTSDSVFVEILEWTDLK